MRYRGAFEEKTVGCLMASGCAISIIGGGLMWVFSVAGIFRGTYTRTPVTNQINDAGTLNLVPLMILVVIIGLLMFCGGMGYGFWKVTREKKGPRATQPNFRILARYVYDKGILITDELAIEQADKPRYYVRGMTPDHVVGEYETTPEVYFQCGEGMVGEAEIQGRWVGRFIPYIGIPPTA
ncbi:hypothetical protein [Fimbriimonas ginsengisoli]|uniref:Uncharacterized protein n=1 Tax=Fimbriimonas ginsengisoli Gsoil 348 TaxID=661478 RepID=A0A068NLL7_FIMGI|nr:hypothetical protein [Fimbriimonas ginsengisoli]AIE84312.1 hypothetical protein OP10G_0944 [Fimbriimonas ginsengisoli Gsoil 348]